jgi:ABC-type branched-subunit amino acid transport system ATPase component
MILRVKDIEKSFGGLKALDSVSLDIKKNTIVGLIGPNGSGKTTLINVISGFIQPEGGRIEFNGRDILSMQPHQIAQLGICRTFQITRVFRRMTVLECMLLASKTHDDGLMKLFLNPGEVSKNMTEDIDRARRFLETLDIGHLGNEYASSLSGGQQKLLSFGMVQMAEPGLVLLDEPVAGINPTLANKIFEKIELEKKSATFLIIEHNTDILMNFCDEIYVMNKGKITAFGTPEEIQCNKKVIDVYLGG